MNSTVKGYAHCGMVAAARWIAKYAIPCLIKSKYQFPDYEIKVINVRSWLMVIDLIIDLLIQLFCLTKNGRYSQFCIFVLI